MFCVDLRTNSDNFSLQQSLIGFYNRGRECLLRSTNWVFKSDRYSFVLEGLIYPEICCHHQASLCFSLSRLWGSVSLTNGHSTWRPFLVSGAWFWGSEEWLDFYIMRAICGGASQVAPIKQTLGKAVTTEHSAWVAQQVTTSFLAAFSNSAGIRWPLHKFAI